MAREKLSKDKAGEEVMRLNRPKVGQRLFEERNINKSMSPR